MSTAIAKRVGHGLAWSSLSTISLRVSSLLVTIILARLLDPAEYGVFAVAAAVQVVLITLADLGLSADLIRTTDFDNRAATVAWLSLVSGITLTAVMAALAQPLAHLMGSPASAPALALMSLTILLASLGVVPGAKLARDFRQKTLFGIALVDFAVSTVVTIGLVLLGLGATALAAGRVAAHLAAVALQFAFTRTKPQFRCNRLLVRSVLAFGLPVAGANLLSWAALSIDRIVIARSTGAAALGLYVVAYNISGWPMSAIGQTVRSVALPAFSRVEQRGLSRTFSTSLALMWSFALAAGTLLAALSSDVVALLFGEKWSDAAPILAVLAFVGSLRVLIDLLNTLLIARGASRPVMWIQAVWLVLLTAGLAVGTASAGSIGAAWAHLAVSALIVIPATLLALRTVGVRMNAVLQAMWPAALTAVPAFATARWLQSATPTPFWGLLAGGIAGMAVFLVPLLPWLMRQFKALRNSLASDGSGRIGSDEGSSGPVSIPTEEHP